jgi:hypothetical protein
MQVVMDLGWIVTFATDASMTPQVSIATEGGSGTEVPDLSIEVDNLDEVLQRVVQGGIAVEYWPSDGAMGRSAVLCARSLRPFAEHPQSRLTLRLY